MGSNSGPRDLRSYLKTFWRWKFLFLAFAVALPVGAYFFERAKPKIYQSSTLVETQDVTIDAAASNAPIQSGNLLAVARLVTTTPVAELAARLLHPPESPGALLSAVSAVGDTTTGFLTITAQAQSPTRAAAIANAFAGALQTHQTQESVQTLDDQIAAARRQLLNTPRSDASEQTALQQQIAQLTAVRGGAGGGTKVIQRAEPSATPVGPATRRITELAGLIGVLLGIGAVLLAENSDRRLRTPEDLERLTNWPLLGVIPSSAFAADHQKPRDHEAIQMLSTSLTYFNVDRPLKSVAVVSPALGDGKTTVAVGLAIASARAGRRAVLVDADLRRSQVAVRMDIDVADGLGAVLAGERRPQDVLMVQQDPDSAEGGNLWVLPAGQPPPNPTKLLESSRMAQLLRWLESNSNLVIVDTAAALAVSDTLPLLKQVSGVVLVVRMNQTSAAVVNRMKKVIEAAHGTVLGVVATDIDPSSTSYQEYYRAGRQKRSRPRNWGRRRRRRRFVRSRNGLASDVEVGATLAPNAEAVRAATVEIPGAASENGDDLAPEPPAVLASRPDS